MIISGRCKIYYENHLINFDINKITHYDIKNYKNYTTIYYGNTLSKQSKSLENKVYKKLYVIVKDESSINFNKIIEFNNCVISKENTYDFYFLSKICNVKLYHYSGSKYKIHDGEYFLRKDKIKSIIKSIDSVL